MPKLPSLFAARLSSLARQRPLACRRRRRCRPRHPVNLRRPAPPQSLSPPSLFGHLQRNPYRKKEKAEKVFFICGTTFKKNESGRDFQQPDLEQSLTKTKQRIMAGTHLQKNIRV